MKFTAADKDSLVQLLTRLYREILEMEAPHRLLMGGGDLRPRIEYFHDAIRAYASGQDSPRLAVELLAYDVSCLRYLESMPLAQLKPATHSPATQPMVMDAHLPATRKRPDRELREQLSERYQQYGLLFAALLKPEADRDHQERIAEINDKFEELTPIIAELELLATGKGSERRLTDLVRHVHDAGAHQLLMQFLHAGGVRKKEKILELIKLLKKRTNRQDDMIAKLEAAHLQYVTNQLGIYEQGKEALKAMAAQGMNLAGKFVEASMAEARRTSGRGR